MTPIWLTTVIREAAEANVRTALAAQNRHLEPWEVTDIVIAVASAMPAPGPWWRPSNAA